MLQRVMSVFRIPSWQQTATWCLAANCVVFAMSSVKAEEHKLSFNRDIRPILSDACFNCHGPDEGQRQSGLRLDRRDAALQPADSGRPAIVPAKPERSELVARITSTDPDQRMPPADSGKTLSGEQIERLRRWIAEGASYEGHWAFDPPVRPAVPRIDPGTVFSNWPQNPIDSFILDRLRRSGLEPSPEASREVLLRRVTLDLTGLPPTPEELNDFVNDSSPLAYEKVVDRLLASPHYGEHMAQAWLDYARFADSNGYQTDGSRHQWPWRDWLIRALNADQPFDQFTIEQLAGDLLPNATQEQIVATGFHRNHRLNGEGGIIAEEWRVETVIDRVETTGLTWLALTLGCCRCHDHKYDPITQKEFYQLFAFFNNVPETGTLQGDGKNTDPVIRVETPAIRQELARLEKVVAAAAERVARAEAQLPMLVAAWEPELRKQLESAEVTWNSLRPGAVRSLGGATLTPLQDGTYLAGGENPAHDTYEIVAPLPAGSITGLLLECFPDASLPNQSLGRYPNGNFVLTRFEAELQVPTGNGDEVESTPIRFARAEADYSQKDWNIRFVNNGNRGKGWAVDGPTRRKPCRAIFVTDAPIAVPPNSRIVVRMFHEAIRQHNIGRFRLSFTSLPPASVTLEGASFPDSVRRALEVPANQRTPSQQEVLAAYYRQNADGPVQQADRELASAREQIKKLRESQPTVMVMREGPRRDAYFLIRGQYDRRGEKVEAAIPAALALPSDAHGDGVSRERSRSPQGSLNRLDLARWIVDRRNPLTARVWVNRAWERFFGTGLVKTSENFGSQAEYPSHPELLDWLACEFMEPASATNPLDATSHGWDMKRLHKMIVMSATYRQQSQTRPDAARIDPENRLLSHAPRIRLTGEAIRDEALAVSGLLVMQIGGPSVRPYMPEGVWDETSRYGDLRNYRVDPGSGRYRRTLYTIWKRTAAPPTMLLFDAPNREVCTVKRSRTNTPLQALSLLNEVTFVEAARKLGERMMRESGPSVEARLTHGFVLALGRKPTESELSVLRDGWQRDIECFRQDAAAADKLLQFGMAGSDPHWDPVELAAYTLTANVLLNLDEFVTRP